MYAQDSFHTLSFNAQLGLLAVSAVLAITLALIAIAAMRGRPVVARFVLASLLYFFFVWASPQIYYEYYKLLLNDLPRQWVIWSPPGVKTLFGLITFTGPQTISAHALGALFWILVCLAWYFRKEPKALRALGLDP